MTVLSLPRALSRLGFCSRSAALRLIAEGRVRVNGSVVLRPELRVLPDRDRIAVDSVAVRQQEKLYLMLNKPRGLVTTADDEKQRPTVYRCLAPEVFPWIAPVGRLDKASEGLLLLSNDTLWADAILDPKRHWPRTYHVQIRSGNNPELPDLLLEGQRVADGEFLRCREARWLRRGQKNGWLSLVLEEGRNRLIRRLLESLEIEVLRLIRIAIGPLQLGKLAQGRYRHLTAEEVQSLRVTQAFLPVEIKLKKIQLK